MENITVNFENLSEQEREQLLGLVKKANETPKKRWRAERGKFYYFIETQGEIERDREVNARFDKNRWCLGNYFKDLQEAQFELEKRKVYQELKDFALEHNEKEINWKDSLQRKHYFYYNHNVGEIQLNGFIYAQEPNQVYFTSKKIAEQAIQTIGENRIKKYLFGITD